MIYQLTGRIEPSNAAELENALTAAFLRKGEIALDASSLEYISPAGIRALLKLRKLQGTLTILNVNKDVYETLDIGGLTKLLDVRRPLRFVSIKGLDIIGEGGHGRVYRLSEDTIIKVFFDDTTPEMIETERRFTEDAFLQGLPSPMAFDIVKTEEGCGVVMEMAGAQTLSTFLTANPDRLDEYAVKFALLQKKLNETRADPSLYPSISALYRQRIDNAKPFITEEEYRTLVMLLEAIPEGKGMVHGDYHPKNVMVNANGDLMLIDLANNSRGNALFDVGGSYSMMVQLGRNMPEVVPHVLGISYEQSLQIFKIAISTYYNTQDAQKIELITRRLQLFGAMRMVMAVGKQGTAASQIRLRLIQQLRESLFPYADEAARLFSEEL